MPRNRYRRRQCPPGPGLHLAPPTPAIESRKKTMHRGGCFASQGAQVDHSLNFDYTITEAVAVDSERVLLENPG